MSSSTGTDLYAHYRQLCGDAPVLTREELSAAIRATGLREDETPSEAFWATLLRRPDHQRVGESAQGDRNAWPTEAQAEHDSWQAQGRADFTAWKGTASDGDQPHWWDAERPHGEASAPPRKLP